MREVPEWIGKTDDARVPPHVRLRIFEREQSDDIVERVARSLGTNIANMGHPVGCGISPHPDMLREIARAAIL